MNSDWFKVFLGAFFEVFWVVGLSHAYNWMTWAGTVVAIFLSFFFLVLAAQKLPVGTVYAVFAGLGTTGTVVVDIVFFNEPFMVLKVVLISLLLLGIIGLKYVTEEGSDA